MNKKQMNIPKLRFTGFTDEWEQRKLGELYKTACSGGTPSSSVEEYYNGNIPFLGISDISGRLIAETKKHISEEGLKNSAAVMIPPGTISLAMYASVGKVGITSVPMATSQAFYNMTFTSSTTRDFVYTLLEKMELFSSWEPLISTGTQRNLNADKVKNLIISVPNENERKQISDCFLFFDALITLQQRKLDQIKAYKKGMLQKMFPKEGESVPEVRFTGFTGEWEQRKVSNVATIIAGGTPSTDVESYWEPKEIPWLSSGEVHKKYITFTDNMISVEGMNHSSAKMVKKNSVLIALAGQGKTRGTVAINRIPLTTNQSIAAMTFDEDIVPEFVFCNLCGRYDEIRKMSSGDGSRGGLNKQLVGDIVIPYTSKAEQKRIGDFLSNLDTLIALHQRKLDALKEYKKGLLQQMFV